MWYFLALALLLLAFCKRFSLLALAVAVGMGVYSGILDVRALAWMAISVALIALHFRLRQHARLRVITEALLVLDALALTLHFAPGFHNLKMLDAVVVSPASVPFTLYYNADKALVPFVLAGCINTLFIAPVAWRAPRRAWFVLAASVPALLCIAVALGGLKFELHLPGWWPQFALANLFFVSLAEEALFRGYLQQRLTQVIHPLAALAASALLFGLMHYSGGPLLMVFAALAGVIYGLAWMWSGRLWVATLFHFGLNVCQLLFFTYPALRAW
ncbi:CPBP family intramembrane metalloprotease [Enterobacteriaceae bacterium YMB-R22]|uniref:CPBP family intramembrane glutamic endopeptidase n=1 Tax=Tenebrionicola larvae TaxID=2815733 RepID=UPI002012A484|nr:CPBP family intramembrane glutamic endopeptidase [Tenebrionicola larvae]MBV4412571.1 CPBP family intramembrane metalloprotease [Tenebrionicola larvae]